MKRTEQLFSPTSDGPAADVVLSTAIAHALARPPAVAIPDDFAARVAQQAASQAQPRVQFGQGWGPRIALASGAVLTIAMFALAPHAAPTLTNAHFDAELVLFVELSGLALFSRRLLHD